MPGTAPVGRRQEAFNSAGVHQAAEGISLEVVNHGPRTMKKAFDIIRPGMPKLRFQTPLREALHFLAQAPCTSPDEH